MAYIDNKISLDYATIATEVRRISGIGDPYIDGQKRLLEHAYFIEPEEYRRICEAAERTARIFEAFAELGIREPEAICEFCSFSPERERMWRNSAGLWHVFARVDTFITPHNTLQVCEINADTPSGAGEAIATTSLFSRYFPELASFNPNKTLPAAFMGAVFQYARAAAADDNPLATVALLYPTDLTEDIAMLTLYKEWLEKAGKRVVLCSPYNLHFTATGKASAFGVELDLIIRHYKTDWWTERISVWDDDLGYSDPLPLEQTAPLMAADATGLTIVVNPFGNIAVQNKLAMAFLHAHKDKFPPQIAEAIDELIPLTYRLCDVTKSRIAQEKDRWVLKSDYGCEGDETVVGAFTTQEKWEQALDLAVPQYWIVQERFDIQPVSDLLPNYGVYIAGGRAVGILTRLSPKATDHKSVVAPTFINGAAANPEG